MAPIDPAQLLKALDSLLSVDGGIRGVDDVPRLASLMKKFSKKLVSRCVYCNVLQSTKPEILSEYLDKGGWDTINTWLQYAKSSPSESFLVEMLKLCNILPMTLKRLKENNTAKLIKSLTKHESNDVKEISNEVVNKWMTIIKDKKNIESTGEKKKKKDKPLKAEKEEYKIHKVETIKKEDKVETIKKEDKVETIKKEDKVETIKKEDKVETIKKEDKVETIKKEDKVVPKVETRSKQIKSPPKSPHIESPKGPNKSRKRPSVDKATKPSDTYDDVIIEPTPAPVAKKPRQDRPKTAKIYQKKFRATGLEEETPLPKSIPKKAAAVDKSAVAAAKSTLKLNASSADRITEKKIKPENLMAVNENASSKGIKLIPAKPRPTYVLHESASFIDALISQPVAPVKRKKKTPPKSVAQTPQATSPTMSPPKLQFYKDTLDEKMNESKTAETKDKDDKENKENVDDVEKMEDESKDGDNKAEISSPNSEEIVPMEVTEEGGHTPPNEEIVGNQSPNEDSDNRDEMRPNLPFDPYNLRSCLSHGKRRGRKKTVRWVEDEQIKEIFYFDMDDTERVNVSKSGNFYDLKFIEMRRERETMEFAKRQSGDNVEEFRKWWNVPILIDIPNPLNIQCNSLEKGIEHIRQQSTLQEIYFTKEMIPDSPHEPDLEIVAQSEPKIIPLDEENAISTLNDFTNYNKPLTPSLPEILSTLMKMNANQPLIPVAQNIVEPMQVKMETEPILPPAQPMMKMEMVNPPNILMPPLLPNIHMPPNPLQPNHIQPVPEPVPLLGTPNGLIPHVPPPYQSPPPEIHGPEMPVEWQGPPPHPIPDVPPPNDFYPGHQMNQNMPPNHHPPPMNIRGGPPPGGNNYRPNFRNGSRGMQPRGRTRVICRHFANGHCRYGMSCTFLHPGVNGPPLL